MIPSSPVAFPRVRAPSGEWPDGRMTKRPWSSTFGVPSTAPHRHRTAPAVRIPLRPRTITVLSRLVLPGPPAPVRWGHAAIQSAGGSGDPLIDDTLRSQARAAIERAWAAAIESGALPPLPDDAGRPTVEVERPANPEHGDLATNLAMKLARPYRRAPLELATLLAAKLVRDAADAKTPVPRSSRSRSRRPGFLNLRLRPDALAATVDGVLERPDDVGPRRPGRSPRRQRRVRVGQPDRPAHHRQRARGVHRRPAEPCPGGRRPAGDARVLLQRLRRPDRQPRRVGRGRQTRRACPRGRVPGRRTSPSSPRTCPTTYGPRPRPTAPTRPRSSAAGQPTRVREGIEASLGATRRPFRRVDQRGTTARARAGSSGRSSACASTTTSTSRTARCGSARPRSATTRTASSTAPTGGRRTSPPTSAT